MPSVVWDGQKMKSQATHWRNRDGVSSAWKLACTCISLRCLDTCSKIFKISHGKVTQLILFRLVIAWISLFLLKPEFFGACFGKRSTLSRELPSVPYIYVSKFSSGKVFAFSVGGFLSVFLAATCDAYAIVSLVAVCKIYSKISHSFHAAKCWLNV